MPTFLLFLFLLYVVPVCIALYTFKRHVDYFIPSVTYLDDEFEENDYTREKKFWIVLISFAIWIYSNLLIISDIVFSSALRGTITWIVLSLSTFLTIKLSAPPVTRPNWSVSNWAGFGGIAAIFVTALFGLFAMISTFSQGSGLDESIPTFFAVILFIISLILWLMLVGFVSIFAGFAVTTILIAQFNFSITTIFLSILVIIFQFNDTGIFNITAYFDHIFNVFSEFFKYGDIVQIIYMAIIALASVVRIIEKTSLLEMLTKGFDW